MVLVLYSKVVYNIIMKYKSNKNIVYSCKYHVVWCPKYRRKVLIGEVEAALEVIKQYIENQKTSERK